MNMSSSSVSAAGDAAIPLSLSGYQCHSSDYAWKPLAGRGTIYSYTIAIHAAHPALVDRVPYAILVVELDDAGGERVVGNLLGSPPDRSNYRCRQ